MNRNWLHTAVMVVVGAIVFLSTVHYTTCQFWANPKAWDLYEKTQGKLPDTEHVTCREVGPKTLATLTSVLATLLALQSQPPP